MTITVSYAGYTYTADTYLEFQAFFQEFTEADVRWETFFENADTAATFALNEKVNMTFDADLDYMAIKDELIHRAGEMMSEKVFLEWAEWAGMGGLTVTHN